MHVDPIAYIAPAAFFLSCALAVIGMIITESIQAYNRSVKNSKTVSPAIILTPDPLNTTAPIQTEPTPELPEPKPQYITGTNIFDGQVITFTGKLEGLKHNEAIAIVQQNGGKAFITMPTSCTMVVIGNKPGAGKLEKAEKHPDTIRTITQQEFFRMITA